MRKKVLSILVVVAVSVILFTGLSAGDEADINRAQACLYNKVEETSLSLQQAIFSALAGIPQNKIEDKIDDEKSSNEDCWPKSGCKVKDTAQVLLAKQKLGQNTDDIVNWLLTKTGPVPDITWYLQITIGDNSAAQCIVHYDNNNYNVNIDDNMKLSGNPGPCLTIVDGSYRLKIAGNCLDKEFAVKCEEKSFKSNLLYRTSGGGTIFVSPNTHEAQGGEWAEAEKINAKCFVQGEGCDYEGSLWAATALYASQEDVSKFIPYLMVLSSNNERHFPSAFLEYIDRGSYYEEIIGVRRTDDPAGNYWFMSGSPYTKFYDTSLAMLALGGKDDAEISRSTIPYLFSVQDDNGCWGGGNIIDTAFIIYSAKWTRIGSGGGSGRGCTSDNDCNADEICVDGTCISVRLDTTCEDVNGTCQSNCTVDEEEVSVDCPDSDEVCCVEESVGDDDDGVGPVPTACSLAGYYCVADAYSCLEAYGEVKPAEQYYCDTYVEVCCTVDVDEGLDTCFHLGGTVCAADEQCTIGTVESSNGACCLELCEPIGGVPECTSNSDCNADEQCSSGVCVAVSDGGGNGEGRNLWIWIIILIILIVLVIIGIIFRDKLRVWWFKFRGKAKTSKIPPHGPPGMLPGRPMPRRGLPRFGPRGRPVAQPARPPPERGRGPVSQKDKEMEETLKKLKEMSK